MERLTDADLDVISEVVGVHTAALLRNGAKVVVVHADDLAGLLDRARQEGKRRRPPVRRAPVRSRKVTPQMAAEIRAVAAAEPNLPMADIARRFGVNPGRVSEVLHPDPARVYPWQEAA